MSPLWLLLIALVAAIVTMEVVQARALKRLGANPPRVVTVLRVTNLLVLAGVLAYAAWVFLVKGR